MGEITVISSRFSVYMRRILFTLLVLVGLSFIVPSSALAASTLSLTPSSGTLAKDSTVRVSVYVNTGGEKVNALQADVAYPTDKLQFLSISTSGTALTIFAEKSGGGGVVHLAGGTPSPGFSGNKLIATVTFKVLLESGTAGLSFTNDSAVLRDSDNANVLTSKGAATYTLSKASSVEVTINVTPTSQPDATATQATSGITDLKVESITPLGAVIVWNTKTKSDSSIEFGETTEYGFVQSDKALVSAHRIVIPGELITLGTLYHFVAKSTDSKGVEVKSEDSTFKTKGFDVLVRVKDANGKPVSGASVSLYSEVQTTETDATGEAKFSDVAPGKHGVVVKKDNQTVIREVVVNDDGQATAIDIPFTQKASKFDISNFPLTNTMLYGFLAGVLLIATLLVIIYIVKAKKKYTEGEL